ALAVERVDVLRGAERGEHVGRCCESARALANPDHLYPLLIDLDIVAHSKVPKFGEGRLIDDDRLARLYVSQAPISHSPRATDSSLGIETNQLDIFCPAVAP